MPALITFCLIFARNCEIPKQNNVYSFIVAFDAIDTAVDELLFHFCKSLKGDFSAVLFIYCILQLSCIVNLEEKVI